MTRKIFSWLSFMAVFSLLLYSCRTDESINENQILPENEKIEAFSRFESHLPSVNVLGKSASDYVSYHEPFKEIIQNFMKNNPEYAERFQREAGEIYFDLRSFTYGETTKGLAYPILKDGTVNAVLVAMVNEQRDWVTFIVLKNSSPEVTAMISKFQKFYDEPAAARGKEQMQEQQIEEVVIVVYQSIPGPSYMYYQPYTDYGSSGGLGLGMSGGPTIHQGGGFYNPAQNPPNPCTKIKSIVNNPQIKAKLTSLQSYANTNTKIENGFQELKSGTLVNGIVNGDNQIEFGIGPNSQGTVHTHQPGTIGIFAPQDIMTFLAIVHAQDANALGNAYSGTISSSGTYFINFTGTASDLPPAMTEAQEAAYVAATVKDYTEKYYKLLKAEGKKSYQTLSSIGLEKLFFDMLDKIGLAGKITLIKEDNGNTSTIQKDSSGNPIPNPC